MVIPYIALGLAWILLEFCICRFYRRETFDFFRYLYYLLIGQKIGSSWFIIALLTTEIIAYALFRLPEKWRLIITAVIAAVGFLMNSRLEEQFIWIANTALIGIIFLNPHSLCGSIQFLNRFRVENNTLFFLRLYCAALPARCLMEQLICCIKDLAVFPCSCLAHGRESFSS